MQHALALGEAHSRRPTLYIDIITLAFINRNYPLHETQVLLYKRTYDFGDQQKASDPE
jgi:hypothetical protein